MPDLSFVLTLGVGVICIILGICNMMGNISTIHSYHRSRVSEEDRIPFGRMVGLGTIITGVGVLAFSAFNFAALYTENSTFVTLGTIAMIAGLVIGLGISFYAMIKYNKGIL